MYSEGIEHNQQGDREVDQAGSVKQVFVSLKHSHHDQQNEKNKLRDESGYIHDSHVWVSHQDFQHDEA